MANTENIEAKLCAYIDGDLDAAGRAEIERHLAANPQHRSLIEQLAKQRDLLRELPRETAPEEILDALQSQMERSVLLGDADVEREAETLRIHRWPQLMAAAAIVLLTVGLGLVIYFVLPRHAGETNYAVMTAQPGAALDADVPATAPLANAESGAFGGGAAGDSASAMTRGKSAAPGVTAAGAVGAERMGIAKDAAAGVADATTGDAMKKSGSADVFAPPAVANTRAGETRIAPGELASAQRELQNADLAQQLKASSGLGDEAMFVVVSTADPSAASSEVTNYLTSNKIAWDTVSQPAPELAIADNQAVSLSRSQQVNVRMKSGPGVGQPAQEPQAHAPQPRAEQVGQQTTGALAEDKQKLEAKSDTGAASAGGAAGQAAPAAPPAQEQQQQQQQQQPQREQEQVPQPPSGGSGAQQQQAGVAEARTNMAQQVEPVSNVVVPDQGLLQAATQAVQDQVLRQKQLRIGGQPQQQQARSRLIIARGMTKQQAAELSVNLSKQTTVQRAAIYEQRPLPEAARRRAFTGSGPTTSPSAAAATTAPATLMKETVEDRATIAPAARATNEGWRDVSPATQPLGAAAPRAQEAHTAQKPTTAPSHLALGATDAAAAVETLSTQPAQELVDVVILVEDDLPPSAEVMEQTAAPAKPATAPNAAPAAAPTTAPATEDAPAPSTQPAPTPEAAP